LPLPLLPLPLPFPFPFPFPFPLPLPLPGAPRASDVGVLTGVLGADVVGGVLVVGVVVGVVGVVGVVEVLVVDVLDSLVEVDVVVGDSRVVSVVRSVVVTTDGADDVELTDGVVTTGVLLVELRWINATMPTITPAVTARISKVMAKVLPAPDFGFAGCGGDAMTGTGCGNVAVAGGAPMMSPRPVRAAATSAAVGRRAGSDCVMARNSGGQAPGRLAGMSGSRNSRATADSTAAPGYSRCPVRLSSKTRPSA